MPTIKIDKASEDMTLDDVIEMFVVYQLGRFHGNRMRAAKALGVSIRTLRNYIVKMNLNLEFPSSGHAARYLPLPERKS